MKQHAREDRYPGGGGIQEHHGRGRAAQFDGDLEGTVKDADGEKAEDTEEEGVPERKAQPAPTRDLKKEAGPAKGRPPERHLKGRESGLNAVFGKRANHRPQQCGREYIKIPRRFR